MDRHFVRPLFPLCFSLLVPLCPVPPYFVWSLVVPRTTHFPHSTQLRIFQNNGTAPHPNPIHFTLIDQLYPPVQYGSSHRQSLGYFAVLIISSFTPTRTLNFFCFFFHLVQERMPAVVISSPSRLRHFQVVSSSIFITSVLLLFFKGMYLFHLIFSFFVALCFSLCEARTSPLSLLCLCTIYP